MPKTTKSGQPKKTEPPSSKQELYKQAKKLGIEGRSQMSKKELAKAIAKTR